MAGSLQDQLLKMGVVDKKKAKKSQHQKRNNVSKNRKAVKSGQKVEEQGLQQELQKVERDKQQRDLELNKQRDETRAKKALLAEVRQIIEQHKVKIEDTAEIAYNFTHDAKIKKLYVDQEQHKQLTLGRLAIAVDEQRYSLIPDKIADKIAHRSPASVIRIEQSPSTESQEDDPYADYQIPDDLMW
jgi:uncharacterized protein YaiL (DUF2058 family)